MPVLAALALLCAQDVPRAPGHWPQWRGPNRDAVSTETGLLKEWPERGPALLWKAEGLGEGVGTVSVAGGFVFLLGYRDGKEFATALDGAGKTVWSVAIGAASGENPGMRYVTMRTPTVDDDRVYVLSYEGVLHCLASADGRVIWKKSYAGDFRAGTPQWGYGDYPLVDGRLLVCAPRTPTALDKMTGQVVWTCTELKDGSFHSAMVPAEIGGVRQYVVFTYRSVSGVVAKTGALAWRAERPGQTAVVPTPVVHDGFVLVSSGFGAGCTAFQVTADGGSFKVAPVYSGKQLEIHHGGLVRVGDHVYGLDYRALRCIDLRTGKEAWTNRCVGKGSIVAADGRLICRGEGGLVALVEATPEGYREKGRMTPALSSSYGAWAHPVVAGGRLYLRVEASLLCYDLRGPDYKEPPPVWKIKLPRATPPAPLEPSGPEPPAAFVPTPQDVVEKMLELAAVTRDDVVYDLGSGDGRIVITAAKKHSCKAVGYEIVPLLVEQSRLKVREAGLVGQVTIEEKDLFTADLSAATVVTIYLGEKYNARLLPQLAKLKPGARIVSHAHLLGKSGPKPEKTVTMKARETGSEHTIHLWTAPLKEE